MTSRERLGRIRGRLTLPLFVKELTEASARRRTYCIRTVYAVVLFVLTVLFARDVLFPIGDSFAVLGRGGTIYVTVMLIQFGGVYLFLPALTAASITAEKERNTLGLLFLTKLSPTKIVLEKFLGRVFPMLCLTLLSLPLLGVAYTLGGLEANLLLEGVVRLIATILMIGAIGVACSAWCRTTAGAFLSTYAILGLLFPGPILLAVSLGMNPSSGPIRWLNSIGEAIRIVPNEPGSVVGIFFGPFQIVMWLESMQRVGMTGFLGRPPWVVFWQATPLLFISVLALCVARASLVPRSEVRPKRYLSRIFHRLDGWFRSLNDRYALGIEIVKAGGSLPDYSPVAWRETTKTPLGSMRYLVRILLLVESPVLLIGVMAAGSHNHNDIGMLGMMTWLLWLGGGLLAAVKGAGLFTNERARQTLDVLLTSPLPTRRILWEKLAGVWRLIFVAMVPTMTTFLLIGYMRYSVAGENPHVVLYCITAASVTITHLALPVFLSLLLGLKMQTQSRATLTSVGVLAALCLTGPILRLVIVGHTSHRFEEWSIYSPSSILYQMTVYKLSPGELVYVLIANTIVYGGMAIALAVGSFVLAPKWLQRDENESFVFVPQPMSRSADIETAQPAEVT